MAGPTEKAQHDLHGRHENQRACQECPQKNQPDERHAILSAIKTDHL